MAFVCIRGLNLEERERGVYGRNQRQTLMASCPSEITTPKHKRKKPKKWIIVLSTWRFCLKMRPTTQQPVSLSITSHLAVMPVHQPPSLARAQYPSATSASVMLSNHESRASAS